MTYRKKTTIESLDLLPRQMPKLDFEAAPKVAPPKKRKPKVQISLTTDEAREIARRKSWPEEDLYILDDRNIVDVIAVENSYMVIRKAFIAQFRGWDKNGVENLSSVRVVNARKIHCRRPVDSRISVYEPRPQSGTAITE
jgi:hypothetical protein